MAQAVTVFRWDDPGAPQLPNGKPSEIIDILTKCLVDGYGDKTPLGWTRPFYDATNQAVVFRNSVAEGGSGGYVKFYSSAANDNNNAPMLVTFAVSMADIDTFFRRGNTTGFTIPSGAGVNKLDRWIVVGTPTAFWFITARNVQTHAVSFVYNPLGFVGDLHSATPNDAGRFIMLFNPQQINGTGISYTDTLNYLTLTLANGPPSTQFNLYDSDGHDANTGYGISSLNSSASTGVSDTRYNSAPLQINHRLPVIVRRASIGIESSVAGSLDRLGVEPMNSQLRPYYRGFIPGLYTTLYLGYRALPWPGNVVLDGQSHLPLQGTNNNAVALFINLEQWYDPYTV